MIIAVFQAANQALQDFRTRVEGLTEAGPKAANLANLSSVEQALHGPFAASLENYERLEMRYLSRCALGVLSLGN